MNKVKEGHKAENLAKEYLDKLNGWKFIKNNFYSNNGEIDLIYLDNETLVFVEVKKRRFNKNLQIEEAISNIKIKKILKTADIFISNNKELKFKETRIDVIFIIEKNNNIDIKHIKNYY